MNKKLLALALATLTVASVNAVPAKRLTKTVTQPDGSTLTVTLIGDEWFHSYVTSDGLVVDFTDDGHAVYRASDGPTAVYAHEIAERDANEQQFITAQSTKLTYNAQRAISPKVTARKAETNIAATSNLRREKGLIKIEQEESQVPHKGTAHVPIILVEYTDVKFRDGANAAQTFEEFFMGEESSARKYFQDASLGQYDPQFHIIGPVTVSKKRVYYGGYDYYGNDEKPGTMVKEAIKLADPTTDFSIFDNDGDGQCDVVIVLYAGVGQASSGVSQSVWPCQWDLTSSRDGAVTCDGVRCNKFAVFNELNGTDQSEIDGIGTFCHEFSHCLGLPDFYETTYNYGYFGMNDWSLMDHGSYNNDGYTPIGYSAYEKAFMGWIELVDGQKNTQYTLPILNNTADPQTLAIALTNTKDPNEYFIFENRAKQDWDSYIRDEGMMITHVTYSTSVWESNSVNNSALQRMTIVPADNRLTATTLSGDLWPKSYATEFTDTSTPAAKTNTGSFLSQPVTEITRNAQTGEISFWVDRSPVIPASVPDVTEPIVEEAGSFTAVWNPVVVEGTDVTYTLQVWPKAGTLPTPGLWLDFSDGINGWTAEGDVKVLSSSLYFGTATTEGAITSDGRIAPENGVVTVAAKAKQYGPDKSSVIVFSLLDDGGNVIAEKEFEVNATAAYYSAAFPELDNDKTYAVKVGNRGKLKRVTLYSVMAFAGDYADSDDIDFENMLADLGEGATAPSKVESSTSGSRMTFSGITDTSYTVTGLQNLTYRYRVKAIPVDESKGTESPWTEVHEIDLSTSGISDISTDMSQASYIVVNGEIVATPGSRLHTVAGLEIKASAPGRFSPAPGVYILSTPGLRPVKILL